MQEKQSCNGGVMQSNGPPVECRTPIMKMDRCVKSATSVWLI